MGFIDKKTQRSLADQYVKEIRVKTPSVNQLAGNLSGGNQQKVVIAKWLMEDPDILILDEPTRGIDVGSKAEIYEVIYEIAKKGAAVIVVSSELPEILGICDRIITVAEGKITAEFSGKTATDKETLLRHWEVYRYDSVKNKIHHGKPVDAEAPHSGHLSDDRAVCNRGSDAEQFLPDCGQLGEPAPSGWRYMALYPAALRCYAYRGAQISLPW